MDRKEAIEIVKKNYPHVSSSGTQFESALRELIPELAESEDERIRKALVKTFEKKLEIGFEWIEFSIPNRSVLDWLERQKEQKHAEQLGGTFTSYDMAKTFTEGQNYVIAHPEKFGLCKPTEWSEEDETCLEYALWCVMKTRHCVAKDACDFDACRYAERWLDSLPERFNLQPKQEWSEEDEKMLASFLHKVEVCDLLTNKENVWIVNRLKSLRPRPHWKPSEEQMISLWQASIYYKSGKIKITGEQLESLYNDLQKL